MSETDGCKGCLTNSMPGKCAIRAPLNCPCQKCLIKVVCKTPCDDIHYYVRRIRIRKELRYESEMNRGSLSYE